MKIPLSPHIQIKILYIRFGKQKVAIFPKIFPKEKQAAESLLFILFI
ncbi:hypothetical protein B14911_25485 [Bacillus sp. NRRL B-14911]|uniref:Uncharacterized protein n=1 Tax=Bacillus infantis NRRL B-14911 TaxID=1367477 RepID=U5LBQ9_9BACI|nr:hypothetical protein N288_14690 [Bacillus infantis NRRL B-14911]EAR68074.1 hypothetical protein B14911_25485 [Bacillus sp. NRRL B-14911]